MAPPIKNIIRESYNVSLSNDELKLFQEYSETVKEKYQIKKNGRWQTNHTAIIRDLIKNGLNKNVFNTTDELVNALVEKRVDEETEDAVKKMNSFGFNDKQKNNLESHLSFNTAIIQDVVRNLHDDQTAFTSTIISLVNKMANQVEKNNSVMVLENKINALEENKLFDENELDRAYGLIKTLRDEAEERKILFAELTNKRVGESK